MISLSDIKLISNLPIEQVADALGVCVSRHLTRCLNPEHNDRSPSLHFCVGGNYCHCFACGWSAKDSIDLVQKVLNVSFVDAVHWLAQTFKVDIHSTFAPLHGIKPRDVKPVVQEKVFPPDIDWLKCLLATTGLTDAARHFLFEERKYNPKVVEWLGIKSINNPQ